jgi:hypothetical protein
MDMGRRTLTNYCKQVKSSVDPLSDEAIRGHGKNWEDGLSLP